MKNLYFLFLALISLCLSAQNIEFADENFKTILLTTDEESTYGTIAYNEMNEVIAIDINDDNEISIEEANNIYWLSIVVNSGSQFLNSPEFDTINTNGLSNFQNLKKLTFISPDYNGQFIEIDFTELVNLTYLAFFQCEINDGLLDFSLQPNLEKLHLENSVNIHEVNVSNCVLLKELFLEVDNLNELDLSNNINLELLDFNNYDGSDPIGNNLVSMDLSNNIMLEYLRIISSNLESINLKNGIPAESLNGSIFIDEIITTKNNFNLCVDDFNVDNVEDYHIRKFNPDNPNDTIVANININDFCSDTPGGVYSSISGNSKMDSNANGYDENDIAIPFQKLNLMVDENDYTYFSTQAGAYDINIGSNYSTIDVTPEPNTLLFSTVSPNTYSGALPFANPEVQNFSFSPGAAYNDVEIYADNSPIIPGMEGLHFIQLTNKGNQTENATVTWQFPSDYMQVDGTSETPIATTVNSYTWNVTDLEPFESRTIEISTTYNTPTDNDFPLNADDVLSFTSNVSTENADQNPDDNEFIQNVTVVNSYDPNDKTCLNGNTVATEQIGDYLYYKIRFENLGTANAQTVTVVDSIDTAMFDITTLTPIKGSHSFQTKIKGNVAQFTFADINLPFEDDSNDGFVVFKIKTLSSVQSGSTVDNQADIYFDYNYPVITNNEETLFTDNLSVEDIDSSYKATLSPNPIKEYFTVQTEAEIAGIEIYDVQDGLLQKLSSNIDNHYFIGNLAKGIYLIKLITQDRMEINVKCIKE